MQESLENQTKLDQIATIEKELAEARRALDGLNSEISGRNQMEEGEEFGTDEESGAPSLGSDTRQMRRSKEIEVSRLEKELEELKK